MTPFDTIESAHDFVRLLSEQVRRVEADVLEDIDAAIEEGAARRLDALRLVHYKLTQLHDHLSAGSRLLNDLHALRRLLTSDSRPTRPSVSASLDVNEASPATAD